MLSDKNQENLKPALYVLLAVVIVIACYLIYSPLARNQMLYRVGLNGWDPGFIGGVQRAVERYDEEKLRMICNTFHGQAGAKHFAPPMRGFPMIESVEDLEKFGAALGYSRKTAGFARLVEFYEKAPMIEGRRICGPYAIR